MATVKMKADQKKTILLDIIRGSKSFFKLQELESLGSKKGIVVNTIKDILQQLVDDGLVTVEKVGSSNLYWSFASDGVQKKKLRCKSLAEECKSMSEEVLRKREYLESERVAKNYTEERRELESKLNALSKIEEEQREELSKFEETDPTVYDKLIADRREVVDEYNKIIDNIFIIQDYICNKFSMEKSEFNSSFGIPQDLDYIQ
ncbi:Mnd1-like meiotic recombination protein [Encephalitozoon hellem ATCC 50504]|uniref:Meiotic nuclear division protein 1 n=1 Tax=Encephalitozoon hellem TaxID=27973 RepID=A0A9Q9F901_ENCHE|nr:Mnd1-like meiotic recombination protein [Encephalitozoon hellem ATCC 50504]AFM99256.1 Mnd1-like meiotic recombination protein [Encephalitozoon hellem ATCC 50504]UTX44244.1 meiotic nuclear division protein 1-like protein [Encephalitozoon hellem]WEL39735.1 meiotic nuclear division protein 1-like protein [Encephalitozoon hellem]|eukprot:XP_003888237.1 Mnd1-like meiotic recombination protein [Encephalitozoon hellem ATCC 50504]